MCCLLTRPSRISTSIWNSLFLTTSSTMQSQTALENTTPLPDEPSIEKNSNKACLKPSHFVSQHMKRHHHQSTWPNKNTSLPLPSSQPYLHQLRLLARKLLSPLLLLLYLLQPLLSALPILN